MEEKEGGVGGRAQPNRPKAKTIWQRKSNNGRYLTTRPKKRKKGGRGKRQLEHFPCSRGRKEGEGKKQWYF